MKHKVVTPLSGLLLLSAFSTAGAQDWSLYRVTGTVVTANDKTLAVIERSGADSLIVAEGDSIEGGRVIDIDTEWVRIGFGETEVRLSLTGSDTVVLNPTQAFRDVTLERDDNGDIYTRVVDAVRLRAALARIAATEPGEEPLLMLRELLLLPANRTITTVNGTPVHASDDVAELLQAAVEADGVNVLALTLESSAGDLESVYLTMRHPDDDV